MFKKLRNKIEEKRNSKNFFWQSLVFWKDLLWIIHRIGQSLMQRADFSLRGSFWRARRCFSAQLIIHVYAVCWNEEILLPYFLRHYSNIADKIFIYDNMSDDNSVAIIKNFPKTKLIQFDTAGKIREDICLRIKNNEWEKSRGLADWVAVVDIDEILWHKNLIEYLRVCKKKGITVPIPLGFDMFSETLPTFPGMVYDEIKLGIFNKNYCKPCIFNPNAIYKINYQYGCHRANPVGKIVVDSSGELKLLHYKYIDLNYVLKRYELYQTRQSEINRKMGWWRQYNSISEAIRRFNIAKNNCKEVA